MAAERIGGSATDVAAEGLAVSPGPDKAAGLEVFCAIKGERPSLERLGRIPLPHGVHHVDVTRAAAP